MAVNQTFDKLMDELKELHAAKSHDYAEDANPYSNFEFAARFAKVPLYKVYLVILGIKYARYHELMGGKEPKNESILDTNKDATTYNGIMTSQTIEQGLEKMKSNG